MDSKRTNERFFFSPLAHCLLCFSYPFAIHPFPFDELFNVFVGAFNIVIKTLHI